MDDKEKQLTIGDEVWVKARVDDVRPNGSVFVFFVDYEGDNWHEGAWLNDLTWKHE